MGELAPQLTEHDLLAPASAAVSAYEAWLCTSDLGKQVRGGRGERGEGERVREAGTEGGGRERGGREGADRVLVFCGPKIGERYRLLDGKVCVEVPGGDGGRGSNRSEEWIGGEPGMTKWKIITKEKRITNSNTSNLNSTQTRLS